ncbi:hypothetical protein T492DRAFT_865267 [Pavlovales sp. CCMP2436]|nr:hypothetical protein T492DRAFT_865267 [Pavlovales sp. CCMP2436]
MVAAPVVVTVRAVRVRRGVLGPVCRAAECDGFSLDDNRRREELALERRDSLLTPPPFFVSSSPSSPCSLPLSQARKPAAAYLLARLKLVLVVHAPARHAYPRRARRGVEFEEPLAAGTTDAGTSTRSSTAMFNVGKTDAKDHEWLRVHAPARGTSSSSKRSRRARPAYGIEAWTCEREEDLESTIEQVFAYPGPVLVDFKVFEGRGDVG